MSVDPRQGPLTDELRCYYDDERHRGLRPHCHGVAVVAYGTIRLCATCDQMRSAVGKATVPRPVPGHELTQLINAAQALAHAERQLTAAVRAARHTGASWSQIGAAVGLTRQAAQQRWAHR